MTDKPISSKLPVILSLSLWFVFALTVGAGVYLRGYRDGATDMRSAVMCALARAADEKEGAAKWCDA